MKKGESDRCSPTEVYNYLGKVWSDIQPKLAEAIFALLKKLRIIVLSGYCFEFSHRGKLSEEVLPQVRRYC